jgi:hypothetical protein
VQVHAKAIANMATEIFMKTPILGGFEHNDPIHIV